MKQIQRSKWIIWLLCLSLVLSSFTVRGEGEGTLPPAGPQIGASSSSVEEASETEESIPAEEPFETVPAESPEDTTAESIEEEPEVVPVQTEGISAEEYLAIKNTQANNYQAIELQGGAASSSDMENSLLQALRMRKQAEIREMDVVIYRGSTYLNVRAEASSSSARIGKLYYSNTAHVLGRVYAEDGIWYHISSGKMDGYVKSEYLISGYEAAELISEVTTTFANVLNDAQRVYRYDNSDSDVIGYVYSGEKYEVDYRTDYFTAIVFKEGEGGRFLGYVPNSSVTLSWELKGGITIEDESRGIQEMLAIQEELSSKDESRSRSVAESIYARSVAESIAAYERYIAESKSRVAAESRSREIASQEAYRASVAAEEARRAAEAASAAARSSNMNNGDYWSMIPEGTSDLRRQIVSNALSYVGKLRYVTGGTSLSSGADCSGFLKAIYKQYGVELYHYSYVIARTGVKVPSLAYARPGDIICYRTWNGGGHVTMFVGYNQYGTPMMVHAPDVGMTVTVCEVYWDGFHTIQNVLWD